MSDLAKQVEQEDAAARLHKGAAASHRRKAKLHAQKRDELIAKCEALGIRVVIHTDQKGSQ